MGTSALPPSDPRPSPFSDWLNSDDHLLTQALTRELSSPSCYSSSSSSSPALDSADFRSFLQSNPSLHRSLTQVGSPVMSCNSIAKEKPESLFNPSCVSAVSNLSSASTQSSAHHHFQREFDKLCNSVFKLSGENSSCISSLLSAAEAAASAPLLSSARALGAGATKVSKRRQSASKKAPIAVLSADAANFREMVQQLTGIPTSRAAAAMAPLLKPQATRPGLYKGPELPTLDTSAGFLNPKQKLPFLQGASLPFGLSTRGERSDGYGEGPAFYGGRCNMGSHGHTNASHPSWDHVGSAKSVSNFPLGNVRELLASNYMVKGGEQACLMQSSTLLERFLMSDDAQSPHLNVDSWLALDGGAITTQSTGLDVANLAT